MARTLVYAWGVGNPAKVMVMVAQGKPRSWGSRHDKDRKATMLIYKTRGHQVRGLNSEISYEDLGSFTSEVKVKTNGRTKVKIKHEMTFIHAATGLRATGRNRTDAFYACMAEVARHNFAKTMSGPKPAPAVDLGAMA